MQNPRLLPGEHTARVNGLDLRYRVAGSGPVLVVQPPGWGVGAIPYEKTFGPFEEHFTVVYYDPRGSGASQTPENAADLHVEALVDDLEALRSHLALDHFALIGHSHGGLLALHYTLRHPRRVTRLVSLDAQLVGVPAHPDERDELPSHEEFAPAWAAFEAVGGFGALGEAASDGDLTALLGMMAPFYFQQLSAVPAFRQMLAARDIPVRTMQAVSATDGGFPLDRRLARLAVPTLVVSGRHDMFCPPSGARTLAETLPQGRLRIFEESGHFPWIEERDAFFHEAIGFLAAPPPTLRA